LGEFREIGGISKSNMRNQTSKMVIQVGSPTIFRGDLDMVHVFVVKPVGLVWKCVENFRIILSSKKV
jgi:hypothetical protein